MKASKRTILGRLRTLRPWPPRAESFDKYTGEEPPLRSELFSAEQMEEHGKNLAVAHRLASGRGPDRLLARLADNESLLFEVCDLLTTAVSANRRIMPAAEWLLDNFYLIEEQIRTAKRHLPKGYSRELPRLASGPSAHLPRVYDLAFEAISHGDGRVDAETLSRFIAAYQTVTPLKVGELWAFPIMLRLGLIENLRRVGARIAASTIERNRASAWADQMMEAVLRDPKSLILVIADMARSSPPLVSSFVSELARRLQGHSAALALPLTWVEQSLAETGLSIEQMVNIGTQEQAGVQVSISNTIGSLRFLGSMDWRDFVESMSVVEKKLLEDPGGIYGRMDFSTRDRYRHVVEEIAKGSPLSESEVARKAIQLAHEGAAKAGGNSDEERTAHVGYYLIDRGRVQLERAARMRLSIGEVARRTGRRTPLLFYLGAIAAITGTLTVGLALEAHRHGIEGWLLALLGIVVALASSQLAVSMVNWFATLIVTPRPLPRMDFSDGLPTQSRTLVVVPTLLTSAADIPDLVEALEVRFLANRDVNLFFGLLTDFVDAPVENLPEDESLVALAHQGIEALNRKYAEPDGDYSDDDGNVVPDRFFLFHRPRRWNVQERRWMGFERKRGKLADLNSLLRGDGRDRFSLIVGDVAALAHTKYVITLDTDTQLPRESARQFVGVMAHPLNRARLVSDKHGNHTRVTDGYGILQPRVDVSLPGANRSRYARLHGGDTGLDPYTRAVSDVYQDVFGEGSFIGKGIYDVDAFEHALAGRLPDNRILSHDLIEGCFARSGLLSDVQLYEEYPSTYVADMSRRHRWIRGDWQLAGWLFSRVPGTSGRRVSNPLSALSQWKLLDNLRRSLVPPALTLLLLLGWTVLPYAPLWTLVVLTVVLLPWVCAIILEAWRKPEEASTEQHLATTTAVAGRHASQSLLTLAFLPYEAIVNLDAIARTGWRMLVTHRRLLEWNPWAMEDPDRRTATLQRRNGLFASVGSMWFTPAIAITLGIVLAASGSPAQAVAAPILLCWLVSPALAWWVSQPLARREADLATSDIAFLRRLARRTWAFFETFVGPDDRWLPPDNEQEHPVAVVAHRTSPTNIGLSLLANLTAYDFGFIAAGQLIERTGNTLDTMSALERYEGHFYNWYDTQSGKPLPPLYISSVDSGNLAGHLMTLRTGLAALADDRIIDVRWFEGLSDTAQCLVEAIGGSTPAPLSRLLRDLEAAYDSRPTTLASARQWVERIGADVSEVAARSGAKGVNLPEPTSATAHAPAGDTDFWTEALVRQCRTMQEELAFVAPWSALPSLPDAADSLTALRGIPTLRELAALEEPLAALPARTESHAGERPVVDQWLEAALEASRRARERIAEIERLTLLCDAFSRMDYEFLYDRARHLLAIGYNVAERRRDASHYDLLASEARLASFVAISQGELPQENWFALGRLLTSFGGERVLLSWSGSMFEYLMPQLVMPTYDNTLLAETARVSVDRQIAYGKVRGVPWGISECGYNSVDASLNYQYRAFGVPGLGLKRGLAEDLVIAPYASALALMVAPEASCANLRRLAADGLAGRFGLYEAIDYTAARLPRGQESAVVRSFMAHHQGMILLSLSHILLDRPMQRRFESDPIFKATLLLLQERIPKTAALYAHPAELSAVRGVTGEAEPPVRVFEHPDTPSPEVQLLSNGRYHVMVTNAGGGSTRWKDLAVTRWREDGTCDNWGTFCYIRDTASGDFWSAAHQPTLQRPVRYEAIFSEARAEFRRRDRDFESHLDIVVSPEDDIELRRLRITNRSRTRRTIDVTSYAEVVLASAAADALHPVFSNLFVQTEIVPQRQAILCTRRPRAHDEPTSWMFHQMAVHGAATSEVSCETDRAAFIGRGHTVAAPRAMLKPGPLAGGQGSVLDPIVAIRQKLTLDPQQTATIDMAFGMADTRDGALALVGKYQDRFLAERVFDLAWTHSGVTLRQINATESDAQLYARMAGSILFANASLRAEPSVLLRNRRGQSGLWGYAISGDLPIVLLQIGDSENIDLVRQLVQAHAYWRLKGLAVDLVIWNEDRGGYRQLLQDQIMGLIAAGIEAHVMDRPGGIFVRRAEQISEEDRILIQSVARAIISDRRGTLLEQVNRRATTEVRVPRLVVARSARTGPAPEPPSRSLLLDNGLGGFTPDGTEYVITLRKGDTTPTPWVNVLANPNFGTVVSESGLAYTWHDNAHEFRLTPWHNDPLTDASGEACYVRDDESGQFWSAAPMPSRGTGTYVARHGFGYSVFEHREDGIATELTVHVAIDAAVKFTSLKLRNLSGRPRRLSVTGYVEWVLGDLKPKTTMHVVTEIDAKSGALLARNSYNTEFPDRVAFFDVDDPGRTVSGDRVEFIGRNGSLRWPAAMSRTRLSGKIGAGLDPCAALQVPLELGDGEEREIVFRLGVGRNAAEAASLLQRFRGPAAARAALDAVRNHWQQTLSAVQVETPDLPVNLLANGWLVYQTMACRLWARSGYYQSGGAFGFRDQLQDAMALIHADPSLLRAQLLRSAGRQFVEGDVQHWWHPPAGRGVRTRCSDDFLWLPLAAARYVEATGDRAVLDESIPFLDGRPVNPGDDSYYDLPGRSAESGSLYEHCARAIVHGLRFGARGLPLMGSGDWNDGMNRVGIEGKGESIWLGFFLYAVLRQFREVALERGDSAFAERCDAESGKLRQNLEQHGWDGEWYRRAYFDDGKPLGSAGNVECRIDSVSQSWAVLSGAADRRRARTAMQSVDARLVRRDSRLIQLLDPPFDRTEEDPGYIRGYVPGVRENGGQYTHGAIWAAMAFAALGERERAWELATLINPLNHARTKEEVATYKVEPYVIAADVYARAPHTGRGGWTWYTGSAGWMYRLIVESLLGVTVEAGHLRIAPCIPAHWPGYTMRYRYRSTTYEIAVEQSPPDAATGAPAVRVSLDGVPQRGDSVPLADDGQTHHVRVDIRAAEKSAA